jgi:hypothetical protein
MVEIKLNLIKLIALNCKEACNFFIIKDQSRTEYVKLSKFNALSLFAYILNYTKLAVKLHYYDRFVKKTSTVLLLKLNNKRVKLNVMDLLLQKKYIFTIGLVLHVLEVYKKSNRKSTEMLKYLLNILIKRFHNA